MKKASKLIAVAAALALVMSMSVSAFAATDSSPNKVPTISGDKVEVESGNAVISDVTEKVVIDMINDVNGTDEEAKEKAQTALKEVLADWAHENDMTFEDNDDLVVIGSFDIELPEGGSVTVDISDKALEEGQQVYVFHWNEELGAWEVYLSVVEDGKVTFEFDSYSPIMITVASDGKTLLTAGGDATEDYVPEPEDDVTEEKSPKTGA